MSTASREPRRHFSITRGFVGGAVFLWAAFGASAALADEFEVGIVVDPSMSEGPDSDFMDGFQLAVDQSPDVSHPVDAEGGDHLGSMDVVMVAADNLASSDDLVAAAVDMAEREDVVIIVADVSSDVLAKLYGPVTGSETFLIAMSNTGGAELPATPYFFAAGDRETLDDLLTDRVPTFEQAFLESYGRPHSDTAARGYLAGRLVDISVEATNRDPSDVEALTVGLLAATGAQDGSDPSAATKLPIATIVVVLVVLVSIGGLAFVARRQRRSKS